MKEGRGRGKNKERGREEKYVQIHQNRHVQQNTNLLPHLSKVDHTPASPMVPL